MSDYQDARGIEITTGASCIYGAPVGRSIALVEGVIDGFTASGRVWVKVVRRTYGGGWSNGKDRVHVGPDRLVIVDALPACDLPTDAETREERRSAQIKRYRERIADLEAGGEPQGWEATRPDVLETYRRWLADTERGA
ncbi:hypothetical protein [Streptomyces sp. NBC_01212]|uniref:hypothetical protein n=1 Tax=Streptomyces sp. NBC_01212 TaxID=2903775 RepID=UPI002E137844|nr:hypothetical protein OG722_05040 [Streptomyces sp. NBC_01212]